MIKNQAISLELQTSTIFWKDYEQVEFEIKAKLADFFQNSVTNTGKQKNR